MANSLKDSYIGYTYEPAPKYADGLRQATSVDELIEHIAWYELIAWDAYDCALLLSDSDFRELKAGLADKRKQRRRWTEKFGAIVMPLPMLVIQMKAYDFKVPWGLVYRRLRDIDLAHVEDGRLCGSYLEQWTAGDE